MTIISKFDLDDTVFFLLESVIQSGVVIQIQSSAYFKENEDQPTINIQYIAQTPNKINVMIHESNSFESKEELIKVITDRFHKTLGEGQA